MKPDAIGASGEHALSARSTPASRADVQRARHRARKIIGLGPFDDLFASLPDPFREGGEMLVSTKAAV